MICIIIFFIINYKLVLFRINLNKYDESKLVGIQGNHPLRLSIINLAIVKQYREGTVEKSVSKYNQVEKEKKILNVPTLKSK